MHELTADGITGLSEHRSYDATPPWAGSGRVIVLANREPFRHEHGPGGEIVVKRSTSGLVTASEPLVQKSGGVWIAHGSGTADRLVVDAWDGVMVPPEDPAYRLRRVWLNAAEEEGYYYGFANEGLWPLCHRAHVRPRFRSTDFDTYWTINARFAEAACDEAQSEPPLVLVQDYHFALAPLMIRQQLPSSTIVAFWHIPWPAAEHLDMCPWAAYLVEGMLGSTLLGFQTRKDCTHFLDSAERLLGAAIDRKRQVVAHAGRRTCVRTYPASVQWPSSWLPEIGSVDACAREIRRRFNLRESDRLVVGIDRMDYTKGIEEKVLCIEQLLEQCPEFIDSLVFVQAAEPSRARLAPYRDLRARVLALVDRVNRRFATAAWRPVHLVEEHEEPREVYRLLRAAEVCYVGSLHDGMNLVGKEFVSARDDERGVLVLSAFAGASEELTDAVIVNPYDVEQTANALARALTMSAAEQQHRMRLMRARVKAWDADRWGTRILEDAANLRSAPASEPLYRSAQEEEQFGDVYVGPATAPRSEETTVTTRSIA
ncbi:MAG: trehalose-6-phosphate synthase [Acidobacteria bacterium]|nr:MAG: trehalose-6-phosphate synthase [Acidobacteriota bacterium]